MPRRVRLARRLAAVAMIALSFMIVVTALIRHGAYGTTDRRTLVIVVRNSRYGMLGALLLVAAVLVLLVSAVFCAIVLLAIEVRSGALITTAMSVGAALQWVALLWLLAGAALQLIPAMQRRSAKSPIGDETPAGERWVIESLAARATTDGPAAFRLAKRTLAAFPPGRLLVAGARTDALRDGYARLGFTVGKRNRVYRAT